MLELSTVPFLGVVSSPTSNLTKFCYIYYPLYSSHVFLRTAAIGALQGGLTMDRFGRKRTIQLGALVATLGAILQCAARNLAMILAGRIVAGWAIGLLSMSVPVYQAECAHPRTRGLIVGLAQQMIGVGFIVST